VSYRAGRLPGYRKASAQQKRAMAAAAVRAEAVRCHCCSTLVLEGQLADHLQTRCMGGRDVRDAVVVRAHRAITIRRLRVRKRGGGRL